MTGENHTARELVDLARYPIHALESEAGCTLVEDCRASLAESSFFALPGFLKPEASALMTREIDGVIPQAHRLENRRTPYQAYEDPAFPPDHPRNRVFQYGSGILGYQWLPDTTAIRALYWWDALPRFLAAALSKPVLYRMEDPYQAIAVLIHNESEATPWHFDDNNDFTVTLMLQAPEAGGAFELVPGIRNDDDENYSGLQDLFEGDEQGVITVPRSAGELVVYQGRHSIHRTTPVVGPRPRILAAMTFVEQPEQRASYEVNRGAFGPKVTREARFSRG